MEAIGKTDFDFYAKFANPLILTLPKPEDRILAAAWATKLKNPESGSEHLRLDYLKLLLFVLQRQKLVGPFVENPNSIEELAEFEPNYNLAHVARQIIEKEQKEKKEKYERELKGEQGDFPPIATEFSSDLLEYAAAQDIPNFGVHAYYAISKEPITEWENTELGMFPKRPRVMEPLGTISDTSFAVLEPRPEEPEESPDKTAKSPAPSPAPSPAQSPEKRPPSPKRKKSPFAKEVLAQPLGTVHPVEEIEDRAPPTWGSNLIEVKETLAERKIDLIEDEEPPEEDFSDLEKSIVAEDIFKEIEALELDEDEFQEQVETSFDAQIEKMKEADEMLDRLDKYLAEFEESEPDLYLSDGETYNYSDAGLDESIRVASVPSSPKEPTPKTDKPRGRTGLKSPVKPAPLAISPPTPPSVHVSPDRPPPSISPPAPVTPPQGERPPPKTPSKIPQPGGSKLPPLEKTKLFAPGVPGGSRLPAPGASRLPAPGASRLPAPGASRLPAPGASRLPAPGTSRLPAPGASRLPAPGASRLLAPGASRLPAPGASRLPAPGASRPPAPGASRVPAAAAPGRPAPGGARPPQRGARGIPKRPSRLQAPGAKDPRIAKAISATRAAAAHDLDRSRPDQEGLLDMETMPDFEDFGSPPQSPFRDIRDYIADIPSSPEDDEEDFLEAQMKEYEVLEKLEEVYERLPKKDHQDIMERTPPVFSKHPEVRELGEQLKYRPDEFGFHPKDLKWKPAKEYFEKNIDVLERPTIFQEQGGEPGLEDEMPPELLDSFVDDSSPGEDRDTELQGINRRVRNLRETSPAITSGLPLTCPKPSATPRRISVLKKRRRIIEGADRGRPDQLSPRSRAQAQYAALLGSPELAEIQGRMPSPAFQSQESFGLPERIGLENVDFILAEEAAARTPPPPSPPIQITPPIFVTHASPRRPAHMPDTPPIVTPDRTLGWATPPHLQKPEIPPNPPPVSPMMRRLKGAAALPEGLQFMTPPDVMKYGSPTDMPMRTPSPPKYERFGHPLFIPPDAPSPSAFDDLREPSLEPLDLSGFEPPLELLEAELGESGILRGFGSPRLNYSAGLHNISRHSERDMSLGVFPEEWEIEHDEIPSPIGVGPFPPITSPSPRQYYRPVPRPETPPLSEEEARFFDEHFPDDPWIKRAAAKAHGVEDDYVEDEEAAEDEESHGWRDPLPIMYTSGASDLERERIPDEYLEMMDHEIGTYDDFRVKRDESDEENYEIPSFNVTPGMLKYSPREKPRHQLFYTPYKHVPRDPFLFHSTPEQAAFEENYQKFSGGIEEESLPDLADLTEDLDLLEFERLEAALKLDDEPYLRRPSPRGPSPRGPSPRGRSPRLPYSPGMSQVYALPATPPMPPPMPLPTQLMGVEATMEFEEPESLLDMPVTPRRLPPPIRPKTKLPWYETPPELRQDVRKLIAEGVPKAPHRIPYYSPSPTREEVDRKRRHELMHLARLGPIVPAEERFADLSRRVTFDQRDALFEETPPEMLPSSPQSPPWSPPPYLGSPTPSPRTPSPSSRGKRAVLRQHIHREMDGSGMSIESHDSDADISFGTSPERIHLKRSAEIRGTPNLGNIPDIPPELLGWKWMDRSF